MYLLPAQSNQLIGRWNPGCGEMDPSWLVPMKIETPSILIVDDDVNVCTTLSDILSENGYIVHTAYTGKDGLISDKKFNVAIIDIKLPDMDGIELLTRLKKMHPESQFIMATGFASLQNSVKALNEGAYAYLMKPMTMDEVLWTLKRALEEQRLKLQLEVSEKKYRMIVENSLDGIIRTRFEDDTVLSVNPSLCKLLEYQPDEILGRSSMELGIWVDPEVRKEVYEILEKDGQVLDFEHSKSKRFRKLNSRAL